MCEEGRRDVVKENRQTRPQGEGTLEFNDAVYVRRFVANAKHLGTRVTRQGSGMENALERSYRASWISRSRTARSRFCSRKLVCPESWTNCYVIDRKVSVIEYISLHVSLGLDHSSELAGMILLRIICFLLHGFDLAARYIYQDIEEAIARKPE